MFEKVKIFFAGIIAAIISFFTLSFLRKRKNVHNNGIGINTVGKEQSGYDAGSQDTESTINTVEIAAEQFGITTQKLEYLAESNNSILQAIRKRQENNQNN